MVRDVLDGISALAVEVHQIGETATQIDERLKRAPTYRAILGLVMLANAGTIATVGGIAAGVAFRLH